MVEDDEPADRQAPDQREPHQLRDPVGPLRQRGRVVAGDAPAHRHPREGVEQGHHRVEHLAAHVLEVQIDAVRAGRLQIAGQSVAAVADARVEAQLVHDVVALLSRPGDADHPVTPDLRNLPHDRPYRPRRGRHDDHVAVLQPADLKEADVGGEPRHAEHPEGGRDGRRPGVEPADTAAVGEPVLLPTDPGEHEVALGEPVVARRHDLPHRPPGHHAAQLDRRRVGRPRVHAPPHVGVEREVDGADEHLPRGGLRRRRLDHPEVGLGGEPVGAGVEQNPAVGASGHLERSLHGLRTTTAAIRTAAGCSGTSTPPAAAARQPPHAPIPPPRTRDL